MDSYRKIENRYRAINLDKEGYNISEKIHLMAIFGVDIDSDIKGLDLLTDEERQFVVDKGIYGLINSGGLLGREEDVTTKVEKHESKYKLWTSKGYSWLYLDGSIG
mgnify:CR=1 FL=1